MMGASEAVRMHKTAEPPTSEFRWEGVGPSHIHAHLTRPVVVQLDTFGAQTVLDLGCGNGWFTEALTRCGFDSMGVDASRSGVQVASLAYPDVKFRQLDALQPLPAELRGRFDAVVAIELLDHVNLPREAIKQAVAALRPGGLLVVTLPFHGYFKNLGLALIDRLDQRWQAAVDHGRLHFFSKSTLLSLIAEAGLDDVQFETIGRLPFIARSMLVAGRKQARGPART